MGQRTIRVNALLKREISDLIHTFYKEETVYITITEVDASPGLRNARVYYSVFGDETSQDAAALCFARSATDIRRRVGQKIVLKYLPFLQFILDHSIESGTKLLKIIDELDE